MWRQSKLLDLKLWQTARQAAEQAWRGGGTLNVARQKHVSAGKAKVKRLERELAQLQATSLEQLQEQVKHQVQLHFALPKFVAHRIRLVGHQEAAGISGMSQVGQL